jgi:tetratricopeptide (TPR) repeat protein
MTHPVASKSLLTLVLFLVCAFPAATRGQAILVEAYLDSALAAAHESDTTKAARLYTLALTEARDQKNSELTARALLGAATVHIQMSQFQEATDNVRAALGIYEQLPDAEPMAFIAGLNSMAMIHFYQKQFEEAESLYVKLIPMLKAERGEDGVLLGVVLNDLALVQIALNHPDKAEQLASKAADIMEARFGSQSAHVAQCLDTIARALHAGGQHETSEKVAIKALDLCQAELGSEHAQFGTHLRTIGEIQKSQGKSQDSLKSFERSLVIQQRQRGDVHPLVVDVREATARLRAQLSPHEDAKGSASADKPSTKSAGRPGPLVADDAQRKPEQAAKK